MRLNNKQRFAGVLLLWTACLTARADDLETRLREMDSVTLLAQVRQRGNAKQGGLIFHKSAAACIKCHGGGEDVSPLGPDLAKVDREATDEYLIESLLYPSKSIRKGFETVTVLLIDGRFISGLRASESDEQLVLRDAANLEQEIVIPQKDIEEVVVGKKSMMPDGLVASLRDEHEFYSLARYVIEIAHGGPERAAQLQPKPHELIVKDDSIDLNHAGILRSLGQQDFEAGQRIYLGHCQNCHGVKGNTPKLPTARAFGSQPLKYGADPHKMFLTLTRGAGLMTPMLHLSPKERYQVVHFIREALMKPANPAYTEIDDAYINGLPVGTRTGEFGSTADRDYGPVLGSELGSSVGNALTFRLADNTTISYDLHRMKAVAWRNGFLDLSQTQHYRQRGERMPKINGQIMPGLDDWQWAFNDSFDLPADAKPPRGPVRGDWLQYYGHYLHGDQAVLSYGIQGRKILETVKAVTTNEVLTLHHTMRIEAGQPTLKLCVARLGDGGAGSGLISFGETSVEGQSGSVAGQMAVVESGPNRKRRQPQARNDSTEKPNTKQAKKDGSSRNTPIVVAAVSGDTDGLIWNIDDSGRIVLTIPPGDLPRVIGIARCSTMDFSLDQIGETMSATVAEILVDPDTMTRGGPLRWPQELTLPGDVGDPINGYALDTIQVPFDNPWNAWLRTSAIDFFDDGRAVVTTHGGDVYIVSGIDDSLQQVTWKRFVAGLFEPFGVRVVDGAIYVTCRDGLKRLHDYDNNGEADFVEAFWIDDDVSNSFHAFNFDLQTDSLGNFYFAKSGQYTQHHRPGAIMRVPPEGGRADVVAWGLRTPNGMGKLNDDRFTVSDNQGPWMPAGKISLIRPESFLGNMPTTGEQNIWLKEKHGGKLPDTFEEPMIWTPQELDNSCGGQIWIADSRFGPLSNRLIHSSYGKGWLYYMSMQEVDDKTQASIVALPHQWDAGVMRLRVNPVDGQLYGVGLSGWQGPAAGKDGCLQRLRYTGEPCRLIESVGVTPAGLELNFNFDVDPTSAGDADAWRGEMWDYLWSKNYGSDQYSVLKPGAKGRDPLPIERVSLDGRQTIRLTIPDLQICDQLSLQMNFQDALGNKFVEQIYLTVHAIPVAE